MTDPKLVPWLKWALGVSFLWLALAHTAPHTPPNSHFNALFGSAPPLFLVSVPLLMSLLLLVFCRKNLRAAAPWLGLLMVGSFGLLGWIPGTSTDPGYGMPVRVMTYNVHYDARTMPKLLDYIRSEKVDVVLLQENAGGESSPAAWLAENLPGWSFTQDRETAIVSRWPLSEIRSVTLQSLPNRRIISAKVLASTPFRVMSVHWSLPQFRKGLMAIGEGATAQEKDYQSTLAEVERVQGPLILGGDFNCPHHHSLMRRLSSQMSSAFGRQGSGVGWTYPSRFPLVRIDHLFGRGPVIFSAARVGPNLGSDHLPLIADATIDAE